MSTQKQLAREYELVYILRPTVAPSEARKVSDRITEVVEKKGAKLTRVDNWGKRKLAYQIQRHTRGVFVMVKLVGFGDVIAELERNLRILDDVIRYQTIRTDEFHDIETLEIDPEEVAFLDVEEGEEEEEDPTFEERLGMKSRERRERPSDDSSDKKASDSDDDSDDSKAEAKDDSKKAKDDSKTEAKADDADASAKDGADEEE